MMLKRLSLVLCFAKNSFSVAKPLHSVVQTGMKSAGCEKNTTQLPLLYSENFNFPVVVTTSKSGAMSPILGIEYTFSSMILFI